MTKCSAPVAEATSITMRPVPAFVGVTFRDRKSTRLNSSHLVISYAVFCLKKKIPVRFVEHHPGLLVDRGHPLEGAAHIARSKRLVTGPARVNAGSLVTRSAVLVVEVRRMW